MRKRWIIWRRVAVGTIARAAPLWVGKPRGAVSALMGSLSCTPFATSSTSSTRHLAHGPAPNTRVRTIAIWNGLSTRSFQGSRSTADPKGLRFPRRRIHGFATRILHDRKWTLRKGKEVVFFEDRADVFELSQRVRQLTAHGANQLNQAQIRWLICGWRNRNR